MQAGDSKGSEQRAQEDLAAKIGIFNEVDNAIGGKGLIAEIDRNNALAQNVLREEIGFFGPWEGAEYTLDVATRDRLIAHARQDAAGAQAMATSALRNSFQSRMIARRAVILIYLLIAMNLASLGFLILG